MIHFHVSTKSIEEIMNIIIKISRSTNFYFVNTKVARKRTISVCVSFGHWLVFERTFHVVTLQLKINTGLLSVLTHSTNNVQIVLEKYYFWLHMFFSET